MMTVLTRLDEKDVARERARAFAYGRSWTR
jgi:hypothetical protein